MRTFVISLIVTILALAPVVGQEGNPVNVSISNPLTAYTNLFFYSGTDLQYACRAKSQQATHTFGRGESTPYVLTSIVVLTNVGTVTTVSDNGFKVNDKIVISGATVDTDLNGTYAIATITSSKIFTIATVAVANATYTESTLKFTTTAPLTTLPIWGIQKFTVATSLITQTQWANGTTTGQICDNRATLTYQ